MSAQNEHAELQITGMRCASCSARLEKNLNEMPEVVAVVNIATEKASVTFDPAVTSVEAIIATVCKAGFDAHPARDFAAEKQERLAMLRRERNRFLISALLTSPLLVEMALMQFGIHLLMPVWAQWLLATPVQFWAG